MIAIVVVLVIFRSFNLINCKASFDENSALSYLSKYGYLDANPFASSHLLDSGVLKEAIDNFQSFAGLNVTGKLDEETLRMMVLPRCGVKDQTPDSFNFNFKRMKRYALLGYTWSTKSLDYRITKYPHNLAQEDVDAEIARAFAVWSEYTDLTFTPSTESANIEISFDSGEHGDGYPFDGPGDILAHAFFPNDVAIHFDESEQWLIGPYCGTNLFQVAVHEIGHSLGLNHSRIKSAVMTPFYKGYDKNFQLDVDDIQGIQAKYGKKTHFYCPAPIEDHILCTNTKIDTIFATAEGEVYVFKDNYYWKLTTDSVAKGYPKIISNGWPGLPGYIDAAITRKDGRTIFFKGKQYWKYIGKNLENAYPRNISKGFPGIPNDLDAVMRWSGNGEIYFFKGSNFWYFGNEVLAKSASISHSFWQGVPHNLDAAFQDRNGYIYFFKDDEYYRYNGITFSVDQQIPAFPRSVGHWWLGCKSKPNRTIGISSSRGRFY